MRAVCIALNPLTSNNSFITRLPHWSQTIFYYRIIRSNNLFISLKKLDLCLNPRLVCLNVLIYLMLITFSI